MMDTVGTRKVPMLQSVLIKLVNFKENVWSVTKKTVRKVGFRCMKT